MDQGMIQNLKHYYKKLVIVRHLWAIERKREVEKISMLDAMHYLQGAWNNVNETTIPNCYKKAGFKVSDDTDAVDIEADIDEDPLDDLPLARLLGSNFMMSNYVGVDDNVPTCEELTDDAIVDDIVASRDATNDDNDDDADDLEIPPVEPPTVDMALKACDTMRLFLQQQTNVTDILEKLCHVDKCVMQTEQEMC